MSFEITEKYIDPRIVDLKLVDREIADGNPYAALLKSIIQQAVFGRGLPNDPRITRDIVAPFAKSNPLCAIRYALLLVAVNDTPATRAQAARIIHPQAKAVSDLAEAGNNYYACAIAAEMYMSGFGIKGKILRSEAYHRQAIAQAVAETGDPLAAAFSRYRLSLFLKALHDDTKGRHNRPEIVEESFFLRLAAADGGIPHAQRDVGIYYADPERKNPLVAGKSPEECLALAEKYFLLAAQQNISTARNSLAKFYERMGRYSDAEPIFQRLWEDGYTSSALDLADMHEKQGNFVAAATIIRKLESEVIIDALLIDLDYSYEGRPGVPKDETRAYRACVLLANTRDPLVTAHIRDIEAKRSALLARAWIEESDGKLRRARPQDDINKTPFMFVSENPREALSELRGKAKEVSVDLALLLASSAATGLAGPVDNAEARRQYGAAARLGHVPSMLEVVERCFEGRPGDPANLTEALRGCRTFLSQDRRREGIPAVRIKRVQEIEANILGEAPGQMPRLWVPDAKGSLRRFAAEDDLDPAVSDPYADIERYVRAANEKEPNEKSAIAAVTAARLFDAAGEQKQALAMYQQAVIHKDMDAGVEVAERYLAGTDGAPNLDDAYYVSAQLCTIFHDLLSSDALRTRADSVRHSILNQAWVLADGEVLHPVRGGVVGDLEPPDPSAQLLFFPRDADGLKGLLDHQETSIDAAVEIAMRLTRAEGCTANPDEAFWRLTGVLIDPQIITITGSPENLSAVSPRREELQKEWNRLAASITITTEQATGDWMIRVAGAPRDAEPTVLPQSGFEEFIELIRAQSPLKQPAPAPVGPRIPTRPFRRRDQGVFFE